MPWACKTAGEQLLSDLGDEVYSCCLRLFGLFSGYHLIALR